MLQERVEPQKEMVVGKWRSQWFRRNACGVLEQHADPGEVRVGEDGWNDALEVRQGKTTQCEINIARKDGTGTKPQTTTDEKQMGKIAKEYKTAVAEEKRRMEERTRELNKVTKNDNKPPEMKKLEKIVLPVRRQWSSGIQWATSDIDKTTSSPPRTTPAATGLHATATFTLNSIDSTCEQTTANGHIWSSRMYRWMLRQQPARDWEGR